MTDCAHNDKSKYVDCATELLEANKEVMRLRTENAELRGQVPKWVSEDDYAPEIHYYIHNYWQGDPIKQRMVLVLDRPQPTNDHSILHAEEVKVK